MECNQLLPDRDILIVRTLTIVYSKRQIESITGVQWRQEYPNRRVHPLKWETRLPSFQLNGDPRVGIFLEPLNNNGGLLFSYTNFTYSDVL